MGEAKGRKKERVKEGEEEASHTPRVTKQPELRAQEKERFSLNSLASRLLSRDARPLLLMLERVAARRSALVLDVRVVGRGCLLHLGGSLVAAERGEGAILGEC